MPNCKLMIKVLFLNDDTFYRILKNNDRKIVSERFIVQKRFSQFSIFEINGLFSPYRLEDPVDSRLSTLNLRKMPKLLKMP